MSEDVEIGMIDDYGSSRSWWTYLVGQRKESEYPMLTTYHSVLSRKAD